MDIKEAMGIVKDFSSNTVGIQAYQIEALATLISLAERVESIKGFPKKKEISDLPQHIFQTICDGETYRQIVVDNYNEALDDCKLYTAKMMDEGRIEKIKQEWNNFINNQKDIPQEYAKIINDNFWDLI